MQQSALSHRATPAPDQNARFPYDPVLRGVWAEQEYARYQSELAPGTVARARFLLGVINCGFPTPRLAEEYFATLDILLEKKPLLREPGEILLGLGTGRSGSTSLAALISTIPGTIATHENPPQLFWSPLEPQLNFHKQRFHRLIRHFPLVVDVAHWWLPAMAAMRAEFPHMRCIALRRNMISCTNSFLRIKTDFNHWAPMQNGIWTPGYWDPAYPSYPLPENAAAAPEKVKADMVMRYIREYNMTLQNLTEAEPRKCLLLQTETLSEPSTLQSIFEFIGREGKPIDRRWNVGSAEDSEQYPFWI